MANKTICSPDSIPMLIMLVKSIIFLGKNGHNQSIAQHQQNRIESGKTTFSNFFDSFLGKNRH